MMTPIQDWTALDQMTEKEAKVLLRMAVANCRTIAGTVKNPMRSDSYTQEGHAQSAGTAFGFLMLWENEFQNRQPKQLDEHHFV